MRRESAIADTSAVLLPLIFGYVVSAVAVYGVVSYLGDVAGLAASPAVVTLLAGCLVVFAALELPAVRVRRSICRRQTPKALVGRYHPSVGGFLWGLDTGTIVSTYRASMASWAALLLCAVGWGGAWTGLFYAAGLCLPLAVVVLSSVVPRAPTWLLAGVDTVGVSDRIMERAPAVLWTSATITVVCAVFLAA